LHIADYYFLLMLYFVHFPVFNYYNFHIPSTAHFLSPCSSHCSGLYIIRLYNHPCTSWHLAWSLPPQTLSLRPPSHCYQQPAGCIHAGVIAVHIPASHLHSNLCQLLRLGYCPLKNSRYVYICMCVRVCMCGFLCVFCFWMCRMRYERGRDRKYERERERERRFNV
jgi:hypothetical protein